MRVSFKVLDDKEVCEIKLSAGTVAIFPADEISPETGRTYAESFPAQYAELHPPKKAEPAKTARKAKGKGRK